MEKFVAVFVVVFAMTLGTACSGKKLEGAPKFPETPPDKVVEKFYSLISEGGKLTIKEAQKMVSPRFREMSLDEFRRAIENYSTETKFAVTQTTLPKAPNKEGDWVAITKLEVKTPSSFEDYFTTTSQVNLILDQTENSWKIDFRADTIVEDDFKNAPADARVEEPSAVK